MKKIGYDDIIKRIRIARILECTAMVNTWGRMKSLFKPVDLTEGSPLKKIVLFMIPMLIGNIAQQLYTTVDSVIVGKFSGDNALAAVGSAGPIVFLMIVFFIGISIGSGIMVSQFFGAKDRDNLSATIECCLVLSGVFSLLLSIISPFVAMPILELLGTPETIITQSHYYLVILMVGNAGMVSFNILSGIIRGLGDSVSPLKYLLVATVINIVLDLYFVAYLDMAAAGVAIATVIAQFVSGTLCLIRLFRMKEFFTVDFKHPKMKRFHFETVFRLGLPAGLTQVIISLAMIVVQSLTNSFGEMFIAANIIVMRIDSFAMMPNMSFGNAMSTYSAQNIGAGRMDRVLKGAKYGTWFAVAVSVVITALLLLFGRYLMAIFTNTDELVDLSMRMMIILAPGYIAMAVSQCLAGIIRGAGDTITPMWISIFTSVVIRVPVAYLLVYLTTSEQHPNGMSESLFISLVSSWVLGAIITFVCYMMGRWKNKGINC